MDSQLGVGMYVRCSIELEHPSNPRRFALGQIVKKLSVDTVEVCFYMQDDQTKLHDVYLVPIKQTYRVNEIFREFILKDTKAIVKSTSAHVLIHSFSHENDLGERFYYVSVIDRGSKSIVQMPESELKVSFVRGDVDVLKQLKRYEFHNPVWYFNRQTVTNSLHTLRNATFGFETLIGSRVFLMEHQVDTIVRALSDDQCRFMLADEVGLGKTIEACVIMKGLKSRFGDLRTLVIVPDSLLLQWKNELSYKFWVEFSVYNESDPSTYQAVNLLFPYEAINTPQGEAVLSMNWDMCMIDETHRLLRLNIEYKRIMRFSQQVNHLLLLSATPIQSRAKEFFQLLSLLEPKKYTSMKEQEFRMLLNKQDFLRKRVYRMMRDLPDYLEDDLAEDCIKDLEEIAVQLGDVILSTYVKQIDIASTDKGLSQVKFALAYIGENYQIERKIIRHRRKEIETKLAKRKLETVSYSMHGADTEFYEDDTYQAVLEYLSLTFNSPPGLIQRAWLSAMFSSPHALLSLIRERQAKLDRRVLTETRYLPEYATCISEDQLLQKLEALASRWLKGVENELSHIKELYDDPDLIKGRYMKVIDYILTETESEKIVLFSTFKETLIPLEKQLRELLGNQTVCGFYTGMSQSALQQAVDDFQGAGECRYMLCDSLGGEGRNFQMADRLIHLDLPWSPVDLEQRIGRLDRIGRTKDVFSVVFYSELTLEEDLLAMWRDGLKLFDESISGIEIALTDIQETITGALSSDIRGGLRSLAPSMNEMLRIMRDRVEEERYYDMTRQLDVHVGKQLVSLIDKFNEEGGSQLAETMMNWSSMAGLKGISGDKGQSVIFRPDNTSINSMKRTLFILPDTKEALRRAKKSGEVRGTFDRKVAVSREALVFFAPGDPFFDSIVNNASETDWGRCAAMELKNAPINWEGLVFTWSVMVDPIPLLSISETLEQIMHVQGYTPLEHFRTFESFNNGDEDRGLEVLQLLSGLHKSQVIHKGQRSNGKINQFIEEFPSDIWIDLIDRSYAQSRTNALKHFKSHLEIDRAREDLQRKLNARKAASVYYRNELIEKKELSRLEQVFQAILEGLENPVIRLESAVYIRMVRANG